MTDKRTIKTGRLVAACYYVECPYCGESIANNDTGSIRWESAESYTLWQDHDYIQCAGEDGCGGCGAKVRIPKVLR